MDESRSTVKSLQAGGTLLIALVAAALSLLTVVAPLPARRPTHEAAPATISLSLLITGRGGIGGPAESHLFDPQMLVVRRGDTVRLRVMNRSFFRHGIEIAGYGIRTGPLTDGSKASEVVTFTATRAGVFEIRCYIPYDPATATCAPDHHRMVSHLVVIDSEAR